jgi:hypothetical protein
LSLQGHEIRVFKDDQRNRPFLDDTFQKARRPSPLLRLPSFLRVFGTPLPPLSPSAPSAPHPITISERSTINTTLHPSRVYGKKLAKIDIISGRFGRFFGSSPLCLSLVFPRVGSSLLLGSMLLFSKAQLVPFKRAYSKGQPPNYYYY